MIDNRQILKRLHPLLLSTYSLEELRTLLQVQLGWSLADIASGHTPYPTVALDVIGYAQRHGKLIELLETLSAERPGVADLSQLLAEVRGGNSGATPTGDVSRPVDRPGQSPVTASKSGTPSVTASPSLLPASPSGAPLIYISYAWGDDQSPSGIERQQAVDQLCAKLEEWRWHVKRDNTELKHGETISEYMKQLGRADRILVILSEKYLRSPYCMAELHFIYQRSLGDQQEFRQRIVPVALTDAKFATPEDRLEHARHWRARHESLKANWELLGSKDQQLLKEMNRWSQDIGDMLAFVNDTLIPRGYDAICRNDFRALREMLTPAS